MSGFCVVDRADILLLLQAWVYAAWQIFAHVWIDYLWDKSSNPECQGNETKSN